MGQKEAVRTLRFDLAMLCFDLAVRCAGPANRRLEVSSQLGHALDGCSSGPLIGDGDVCKNFPSLCSYCAIVMP